MKKSKRLEDIQNRLSLAMAERSIYEIYGKGNRHYDQLSEVIRAILGEYKQTGRKSGNKIRHGFRLYGTDYHLVVLTDNEKF